MNSVKIITRDINGYTRVHLMDWCKVSSFIDAGEITDEDEILLVFVNESCIYSALNSNPITLEDLTGFFG
jgi:hypothetical protein